MTTRALPNPNLPPPVTLYRVRFTGYNGDVYLLDTTDPGKIGPWLAEMYGLFSYWSAAPTQVEIRTIEGFR